MHSTWSGKGARGCAKRVRHGSRSLNERVVRLIAHAPTLLKGCDGDSRVDVVNPDAVGRKVNRGAASDVIDGSLTAAVCTKASEGLLAINRRDIYN